MYLCLRWYPRQFLRILIPMLASIRPSFAPPFLPEATLGNTETPERPTAGSSFKVTRPCRPSSPKGTGEKHAEALHAAEALRQRETKAAEKAATVEEDMLMRVAEKASGGVMRAQLAEAGASDGGNASRPSPAGKKGTGEKLNDRDGKAYLSHCFATNTSPTAIRAAKSRTAASVERGGGQGEGAGAGGAVLKKGRGIHGHGLKGSGSRSQHVQDVARQQEIVASARAAEDDRIHAEKLRGLHENAEGQPGNPPSSRRVVASLVERTKILAVKNIQ